MITAHGLQISLDAVMPGNHGDAGEAAFSRLRLHDQRNAAAKEVQGGGHA